MGCQFSQQDARIYCEKGLLDAYIYVNIGCLFLRENSHQGSLDTGGGYSVVLIVSLLVSLIMEAIAA